MPFDYRYAPALESGVLLRRYKRFLADVRFEDGTEMTVHCPNPGSMQGLAEPGNPVRVRDSQNPKRKLRYTLEQVRAGRTWVGVNTQLQNPVVASALARGAVEAWQGFDAIQAEVDDGEGSRLDFRLRGPQGDLWVEVKNTTLRQDGEARFPDAVTARGLKHIHALVDRIEAGDRAGLLFVVSRADASVFRPAYAIDPAYATALAAAQRRGLEIHARQCRIDKRGLTLGQALTVQCGPLP